jgi:hypothetical protein
VSSRSGFKASNLYPISSCDRLLSLQTTRKRGALLQIAPRREIFRFAARFDMMTSLELGNPRGVQSSDRPANKFACAPLLCVL